MRVTIIPFAHFRAHFQEPIQLEFKGSPTGKHIFETLEHLYPKAKELLASTQLAYGEDYFTKEEALEEGGEYCLIPPVSGG